MGTGALWEAEQAKGRQPLVQNSGALNPLPVLSLLGAVGAGERPWCYPTSEDTRSPPLASSVLRKLRPRAESDLHRRRPGPRGSGRPRQCSAPARGSGAGSGLPGRPPAAHPGADTSRVPSWVSAAASAGLQTLRAAGRPHSHTGPQPPSAQQSPRRAHFPPRARSTRRPAGLPSRHPLGGPALGGPRRLVCIPGPSDRLGSPSWPSRLSHSAGPTHPPRCRQAPGQQPPAAHPAPVMPILQIETEA